MRPSARHAPESHCNEDQQEQHTRIDKPDLQVRLAARRCHDPGADGVLRRSRRSRRAASADVDHRCRLRYGDLLRAIVDRIVPQPRRLVGVDQAEAGIKRAAQLLPDATWLVGDIYGLPLDERFDRCSALRCSSTCTSPSAPSMNCVECVHRAVARPSCAGCARDDWDGHVNFWDESQLRAFLAPSGLTAIDRIEGGQVLVAWLSPPP